MYTNMDTSQTASRFYTEGHISVEERVIHVYTSTDTASTL